MATIVGKPPVGMMVEGGVSEGTAAERLPVVELKPFMSKQWRPCKSVADACETRSLPSSLNGYGPRKAGPGSVTSDAEAEVKKLVESPRSNNLQNKALSKKTFSIHPKTQGDSISVDSQQAFATNFHREKSTLDEIRNGGSKVVFSCLRRALSELDLRKQQDMKVHGRKLEDVPNKGNVTYADSWGYYKRKTANNTADASVTQSLPNPDSMDRLCLHLEDMELIPHMDESIYDAFDRSSTLPSINVRNAPMKVRRPRTERGLRQKSGKIRQKSGYRLGVANSLDVLSHYGKPVEVEQHLSNDLKRTIKQIKKTKDLSFYDPSILPLNRYGGSIFTPRWDIGNTDSEAFKRRERNLKQQPAAQKSSTEVNLEISSISSANGFNHSKTSPTKASREPQKGNGSISLSRQNYNRPLIASRSSLSSSVPNAAMSARALSIMRAETLPAIAPGSLVHGLQETTYTRSQILSSSDLLTDTPNRTGADSSRSSVENMPRIAKSGPKSSPASSNRSSVSSDTVLRANELEMSGELTVVGTNDENYDPEVNKDTKDTFETPANLCNEVMKGDIIEGRKDEEGVTNGTQEKETTPETDVADDKPIMTEIEGRAVKGEDATTEERTNKNLDVNSNIIMNPTTYINELETGEAMASA